MVVRQSCKLKVASSILAGGTRYFLCFLFVRFQDKSSNENWVSFGGLFYISTSAPLFIPLFCGRQYIVFMVTQIALNQYLFCFSASVSVIRLIFGTIIGNLQVLLFSIIGHLIKLST